MVTFILVKSKGNINWKKYDKEHVEKKISLNKVKTEPSWDLSLNIISKIAY